MSGASAHAVRQQLERGTITAAECLQPLAATALHGATRRIRFDACDLLGDLAGRGLGADWQVAERAAFALLEAARTADTSADKRGVLRAMGRGFRNVWLGPFMHRRLHDRDETIVATAIEAAGGVALPAFEQTIAAFATPQSPFRLQAIAALGRMGAVTSVPVLLPFLNGEASEAIATLHAMTEIRSPLGAEAATKILEGDFEAELRLAAAKYLAEIGHGAALPGLRRLARHADSNIRIAASMAARALKAERTDHASDRFLVAVAEADFAVRAVLARRLRNLPAATIVDNAQALFDQDQAGVIRVLAELRLEPVTRFLMSVANDAGIALGIRILAVTAIEAEEQWERDWLFSLAGDATNDPSLRAAALQMIGGFASQADLQNVAQFAEDRLAALRNAALWTFQFALGASFDASQLSQPLTKLLRDDEPAVRKRAAYVCGNLGLKQLDAAIVACTHFDQAVEVRLAGYVALGELGESSALATLVANLTAEQDPQVLGAASNALVSLKPRAQDICKLTTKAKAMLAHSHPRVREAGCEIAGLLGATQFATELAALTSDPIATVRGAEVWAFGRSGDSSTQQYLFAAFDDDDPTVAERGSIGLLSLATPEAIRHAIAFVASEADEQARFAIAQALEVPATMAADIASTLDAALAKIDGNDLVFEALLELKIKLASTTGAGSAAPVDVEASITKQFPAFGQLASLPGFAALIKSLRTAESLFLGNANDPTADQSPPITLWMKVLENFIHAWLGPRFAQLQREPSALFGYVDEIVAESWQGFARSIEPKWQDPTHIGKASVDVPLRAAPNAVRDIQEHRRKRLDSPLSVTEWGRLMLLFGVDHVSGFKNLLKLGDRKKASSDKVIGLSHRLQALAAVRNLVTHRANAGTETLSEFRKLYYSAFNELVGFAG